MQVGPWRRFFESGQLWDEGEFVRGKKVGEWKVYEKTGALKSCKTYKPTKYVATGWPSMHHNLHSSGLPSAAAEFKRLVDSKVRFGS
jgi:hypothetical protein